MVIINIRSHWSCFCKISHKAFEVFLKADFFLGPVFFQMFFWNQLREVSGWWLSDQISAMHDRRHMDLVNYWEALYTWDVTTFHHCLHHHHHHLNRRVQYWSWMRWEENRQEVTLATSEIGLQINHHYMYYHLFWNWKTALSTVHLCRSQQEKALIIKRTSGTDRRKPWWELRWFSDLTVS